MNWKTDLKLSDLESTTKIETTCKRCGYARVETKPEFIGRTTLPERLYLDEIEYSLQCSQRHCGGGIRLMVLFEGKNEGFVGGMA